MTTQLLTDLTVADICDGFVYNELEGKGLFGWGGKLVIQPEYQRNYISRNCLVKGRNYQHSQLPNALQNAQPSERE